MYTKDKISNGIEITRAGVHSMSGSPFYLFLCPKNSQSTEMSTTLKVTLSDGKEEQVFPFMLNTWNPVSVMKANITSGDLSKYKIFMGTEG